jgi:hypothetical protein
MRYAKKAKPPIFYAHLHSEQRRASYSDIVDVHREGVGEERAEVEKEYDLFDVLDRADDAQLS